MYKTDLGLKGNDWKYLLQDSDIFKLDDLYLLNIIYNCPDCKATATELALKMNISHYGTINLKVGRLGKRIAERMNIAVTQRENGTYRWWHVLFRGEDTDEGFYWMLRPELKDAIEEMVNNDELNITYFPVVSSSWEIISPTIFLKTIDKSALHNHGTGVPVDIRKYFGLEDIVRGERKEVDLLYNEVKYDAHFQADKLDNYRTRLFWRQDLAALLRTIYPEWYEIFKNDKEELEERPKIRFSKLDDTVYELSFIHPGTIEKDIQSEIEEENLITEGKARFYKSKVYERSSANRHKAIEIHGTSCIVCGFDYEKHYGDRGKGYIEVHHIKPLSEIDEEEVVINPENDLVPVCSNCHKMIHRYNDTLTLEEIKGIYKR